MNTPEPGDPPPSEPTPDEPLFEKPLAESLPPEPPNPEPVTPHRRPGPIVASLQPLPTPPEPPPGLPDGCGCAMLSSFFWVLLVGVFFGFCTLVFPEDNNFFRAPVIPVWFFWGGLILLAVGALFLGRRAERAWHELETATSPGRAVVIQCGLLFGLPTAVYLFLRVVCSR